MRKTTENIASMRLSMKISNSVSDMIGKSIKEIKQVSVETGREVDEVVEEYIEDFLKFTWTDDAVNKSFKGFHDESLTNTKMPRELLDKEGVPMVEVNGEQINGLQSTFAQASSDFREHNISRLLSQLNRNPSKNQEVIDALAEVKKNADWLEKGVIKNDEFMKRREYSLTQYLSLFANMVARVSV